MSEAGKKLNELRIVEIKEELEKRKLDIVGAKAALIERLEKALRDEGKDPTKHLFGAVNKSAAAKQSPTKKSVETFVPVKIKEEKVEEDENANETFDGDDDGTVNGNNEEDYNEGNEGDDDEVDQVGTVDDECIIIENDDNETENEIEDDDEEENGDHKTSNDAEIHEEVDADNAEAANNDIDESIYLTIGEDEQKLLHDEDPDDKEKAVAEKPAVSQQNKDKGKAAANKEKVIKTAITNNKNDKKKDDGKAAPKPQRKQAAEKKTDNSSAKTTSKTNSKDDKEKATNATTNATAATASSANGESAGKSGGGSSSSNKDSSVATSANAKSAGASTAAANKSGVATPSRNLWVSGLSALTRASDLKTIFSKHGKVIGAKVVTNTRTPGTRCYGYVTMSSAADASRCIEHLHHTELHGRIISVERTKNEINTTSSGAAAASVGGNKAATAAAGKASNDSKKVHHKAVRDDKTTQRKSRANSSGTKRDGDKRSSERGIETNKRRKSISKDDRKDDRDGGTVIRRGPIRPHHIVGRPDQTHHRPPYRPPVAAANYEREQRLREREREQRIRQQREILSYQKIREERERQRLRERERELREEERRRREIRERQREEESRLQEERKKLALERERLERDKAELLRLERERQKQEREKIELERLELKRHMKIIQSRDEPVKRVSKRDDNYVDNSERKRAVGADRFEAPPPPRFDTSLVPARSYVEKKRDDYVGTSSSKRIDYAKRDDYPNTGSKRAVLDDYVSVPSKRSSTNDYLSASTKRALDDYANSKRDEYKREVEIRHLSTAGVGGGGAVGGASSFHATSRDLSSSIHKPSNRYVDADRTSSNYRRLEDIRKLPNFRPSTAGGSSGKRYDGTGGYGASAGGGAGSGSSNNMWTPNAHLPHGSNGMSSVIHSTSGWQKSLTVDEPNWRPMQSSAPDHRYDRTYNERSGGGGAAGGGYPSSSIGGGSSGMYGSSSGRSAPDRYGPQVSSRY